MSRRVLVLTLIVLLMEACIAAFASAQVHIGDPIEYRVNIGPCDSVEVIEPKSVPLRILPVQCQVVLEDGGELVFHAALFDTGTIDVPALGVVTYRSGQPLDTFLSEERLIQVASILDDTTETPRPIKPYVEHPLRFADLWREYSLWAAIAVGVAALLYGIVWWRRRTKGGIEEQILPQLPPAELALKELISLRDKKYPDRGMLKEYYSEYSEIMRRYLEGNYSFPALEMTTHELSLEFKREVFPPCWQQELLPVLHQADLVKFAKEVPSLSDCARILDTGFRLVDLTRPLDNGATEKQAA